jgi:DNA-cytosine methyltransferase
MIIKKHASLYTGFGMFDWAAQEAGLENVFQVEIEKFPQRVLETRFPFTKKYWDIKRVDFTQYRYTIDILSGGFPCQPHSVAGQRKGREDERNLIPDTLRAFREIKPRWGVLENVYGLLNTDNGKFFEHDIIAPLEDEGYTVQPYIIPASAVGAVHRRDRLWIIAHSKNFGRDGWNMYRGEVQGEEKEKDALGIKGPGKVCSSSDSTDNGLNRNDTSCNKEEKFISDIQQSGSRGSSWVEGCGSGIVTDSDSNAIKGKEREFFVQQEQRRHMQGLQGEISGSEFDTNPKNERLQGSKQTIQEKGAQSLNKLLYGCGGEWDRNWIEVAAQLCRVDAPSSEGLVKSSDYKRRFKELGMTKTQLRQARLEGLGNGIQWEIAYIFFELIKQYENKA